MGIPLSAPIAHDEPVTVGYRANSIGSTLLVIFGALAILIAPVVIGVAMGQFWIKYSTFVQTAETKYTGRAAMRAVAQDGSEYLWSSSDDMKELLHGDAREATPFVSVLCDDRNRDGHPDAYKFTVAIPLRKPTDVIQTFQLLPTFKYRVNNDLITLEQTAGPFIDVTVPNPTGSRRLEIDGRMDFAQTAPVRSTPYVKYDEVYQASYLDDMTSIADLAALPRIGRRFATRNETARFVPTATSVLGTAAPTSTSTVLASAPTQEDITAAVQSGDAALALRVLTQTPPAMFTAVVTMEVPEATVHYAPSIEEALKAAWIQYFCIAYVVWWFVSVVRRFFVLQAMVNTIALVRGSK